MQINEPLIIGGASQSTVHSLTTSSDTAVFNRPSEYRRISLAVQKTKKSIVPPRPSKTELLTDIQSLNSILEW